MIGVVGFKNQRLEIPNDMDPEWASLIENCWRRLATFLVITDGDHIITLYRVHTTPEYIVCMVS